VDQILAVREFLFAAAKSWQYQLFPDLAETTTSLPTLLSLPSFVEMMRERPRRKIHRLQNLSRARRSLGEEASSGSHRAALRTARQQRTPGEVSQTEALLARVREVATPCCFRQELLE
jgi:hypothetical protein